ncbi:hypothetical protein PAHAL_6G255500 [Panicum hallii]|uniref:Uncharacterized protein n=1 Tax=Panicum hallii TaxID=206008 RepID=A0A2T8IHI7_9POAL|nr:hypothetical protein PAHAL_6G255500 [Panicum hallii]
MPYVTNGPQMSSKAFPREIEEIVEPSPITPTEEVRTGVAPSDIQVYLEGHRGRDPTNPDQLCSQAATERLAAYGDQMIARHGEGYDWRNVPIDPEAVYSSGGGKPHGRYPLFDKVIDSSQVPSRQRAGSSRSASRSTSSGDDSAEVVRLREKVRQQELQQQWFEAQLAQQNAILQINLNCYNLG